MVGPFMLAAFILVVLLGIGPWLGSFAMKYPIYNTQGYLPDYAPEPDKETGGYMSQGWLRMRERTNLRLLLAFGLCIEHDKKS